MDIIKDRLRRRKSRSPHSGTSDGSPRRSRRLKAASSGKEQLPIYSPSSHPKSQLPAPALVQSSSSASTAPHSHHVRAGPDTNRRQLSWCHAHDEATSPTTRAEDAQDARFTFFTFPPELRNMIYEYSLQYPDSRQLYSSYYLHKQLELDASRSNRRPTSPTPWAPRIRPQTILLLNKRITNECLPMLKSRTLVIDRLPPPRALRERKSFAIKACSTRRHDDFHHFMQLSDFITPRTLQSIPHIEINVGLCEGPLSSGWAWRPVIEELLDILKQRNVCTKLRLLLRLCNTHEDRIAWQSDQQHVSWIEKVRFARMLSQVALPVYFLGGFFLSNVTCQACFPLVFSIFPRAQEC